MYEKSQLSVTFVNIVELHEKKIFLLFIIIVEFREK